MAHMTLPEMVEPATAILDVIKIIDARRTQIALVHREGHLVGTVTDGDVRRGILAGIPFDAPVSKVMNTSPVTAPAKTTNDEAIEIMKKHSIHQLPLVDETGKIVDLKFLDDIWRRPGEENWVVLMAGGLGQRLRPLTEECPKPMLRVGGRPILETILTGFLEHGFRHILISVNYKADSIKEYFGDGREWDAEISYIDESERGGTAGALALLPDRPRKPFFVMNGDVLTKVNFRQLMQFHTEHAALATMGVREYRLKIPYGVVTMNDLVVGAIDEKPEQKFFVNAGIYVLDPGALDHLDGDRVIDMPQLFQRMMARGHAPAAFPLREYWIDIGRMDDVEQAESDFVGNFR